MIERRRGRKEKRRRREGGAFEREASLPLFHFLL
jgi:hypothetical protein